ncbi:Retaining alpha-galactosidase precursor [Planctomycetes bacterium K2D]|nr:Retaining alpha-galactosidase precursor [Planctomycetes bacterium K2D]
MLDWARLTRRVVCLACCFVAISCATAETVLEVASPDGRVALAVSLDDDGAPSYTVSYDGKSVVRRSQLGVVCADGDYSRGLRRIDCSDVVVDRQRYELWTGPTSRIDHLRHRKTVRFANADGNEVLIDGVASDEGAAFRYRFEKPTGERREVLRERTFFRFTTRAKGWLTPYHAAGEHTPNDEDYFFRVAVGDPPIESRAKPAGWAMPALIEPSTSGPAVLLCESGDVGDFCGSHLVNGAEPGSYEIAFAAADETHQAPKSVPFSATPASTTPWALPWRVILVGEPRDFVTATLVTDVASPSRISDTSWIKPGRASWGWLSQHEGPYRREFFDKFTDLAAEYGWEYTTFDGGWWNADLQEISQHARQRGVRPLVWMYSGDCYDGQHRREKLDHYKACGAAGVKIDFWATQLQHGMQAIRDTLQDAAERELVVVLHGCPTPRGWHRTWPNLLSCEAVLGMESYIYDNRYPEKVAELNCVLPFTRNVAGPMDATPLRLAPLVGTQRTTTVAHELATPIVFTSGVIHYADGPEAYNALPAAAQTVLREAPAQWDESRCLVGEPGKRVVVARRSGDDWFIAGLNGQDQHSEVELDLSPYADARTLVAITDDAESGQFEIVEAPAVPAKWRYKVPARGGFVLLLNRRDDQSTAAAEVDPMGSGATKR